MPNETYKIRINSPLIRPGITIETEVSDKYLVDAVRNLLDKIREINTERSNC
jgi:hypothetical protein